MSTDEREREQDAWESGWTRRATVASDLIELRDCVTCTNDPERFPEHVETLIRVYLPEQGEPPS